MIKMHTARFFNDSYGGREERVQLFQWNMTLEEGHIRYGSYGTHGRLVCSHCDTAIKHVKEKKSIAGGSLRERHEHFETVRGEKHADDCAWGIKPHHQKRLMVDKTKGYRIHLNLPHFSEEFNEAANGAYRRKRGFIYELADDLKDRERVVVESARELQDFMEKADKSRLNSSMVVASNRAISWEDFYITKGNVHAMKRLLARASNRDEKASAFCMIEIETDRSYYILGERGKKLNPQITHLREKDLRGKKQRIDVSVNFHEAIAQHDAGAQVAFSGFERHYLVLGRVSHRRFEGDYVTIHYLNLSPRAAQIAVMKPVCVPCEPVISQAIPSAP